MRRKLIIGQASHGLPPVGGCAINAKVRFEPRCCFIVKRHPHPFRPGVFVHLAQQLPRPPFRPQLDFCAPILHFKTFARLPRIQSERSLSSASWAPLYHHHSRKDMSGLP